MGLKGIKIREIRLSQEREQNRLFPIVAFSGTVFLGTAQLLFNLQNYLIQWLLCLVIEKEKAEVYWLNNLLKTILLLIKETVSKI